MRKTLLELLENSGQLSVETIVLRMAVATAMAFFIYISYALSHEGSIYSKKFNVSLMAPYHHHHRGDDRHRQQHRPVPGHGGRTVHRPAFVPPSRTPGTPSTSSGASWWGICCGAGDFLSAAAGSTFTFLVLLLFGRIRNDDRMLLIIRADRIGEDKIEALVFQYYARRAVLRVKNTTPETVEFIYELSRRTMQRAEGAGGAVKMGVSITDAIYGVEGVEYCNLVVQNDEVSS